jgi:DNA-binding GntR family transcriptional regulator
MSIDTTILRAMLRLSRRREAADEDALTVRSGHSRAAVRDALRRLQAQGLVERRPSLPPRLTMTGLAVAVALLPPSSALPAARAARRARRDSRAA